MKKTLSVLLSICGALIAQENVVHETTRATTVVSQQVTTTTTTVVQEKPVVLRAMILVDNRAGAQYNDQVVRFESTVASQVSPDLLRIISREEAVKSQKLYEAEQPTAAAVDTEPKSSPGFLPELKNAVFGSAAGKVSGTAPTMEDWKIIRNSTAINMARAIGADLILAVSLDSVNSEIRTYTGNGIKTKNQVITLRGACRVLDLNSGETIVAIPVKTARAIRQSEGLQIEITDVTAELMETAGAMLASDLTTKSADLRAVKPAAEIDVQILCGSVDLQGADLTFPDIRVLENGDVVSAERPLSLVPAATVELDGFMVGSVPCTIKVRPGLHKIRLVSPGYADYSGNLKVSETTRELSFAMQMTPDGFARWQQVRRFLQDLAKDKKLLEAFLRKDRKLTDAEVKQIEGLAEMYKNSYFKISRLPDTLVTGGRNLLDILNLK